MFSEGQKRRASLNILEKLRSQGMPEKSADEGFDSMFASVDEEGNIVDGKEASKDKEEEKKKKKKKTALPDIEGEIPDRAFPPIPSSGGN